MGSPFGGLRVTSLFCGGGVRRMRALGSGHQEFPGFGVNFSPGKILDGLICRLPLGNPAVIFRASLDGDIASRLAIGRKDVGLTPLGDLVFITASAGRRAP